MTPQLRRWLPVGAIAGTLAAAAAFNRWSATKAEREHPPLGKFVEIDGVRVHYVERGSGSTIVLLHGSGSLIQDFIVSGIVDDLAQDHRVIVFDRPGYGYSERPRDRSWTPEAQADLLARAAAEIGVEDAIVVGHSWGTLPALAWALNRPESVRGLVLISGYYFATPRPDAILTAVAGSPIIGDLFTATIAPLQTRVTGPLGIKMIFAPADPPDAFMALMPFDLMLRPSQLHATAADSGQMPLAAARLEKRYGDLSLPVTVVWGDGDTLVDQDRHSATLVRRLAAAHITLRGHGHMVHHTAPDEIVSAIRASGG